MNREERILEFDIIKNQWMQFAMTEHAKKRIAETVPFLSELELKHELLETTEGRKFLDKFGNPPLVSLNGMEEILLIASKGGCLSAGQLSQVKGALVAVKRMKSYLEQGKTYHISLAWYEENLDDLEELQEEIESAVSNEEVLDHASARLFDIRRELLSCEDRMREKADQAIRANKEFMSDSFSTLRGGHFCVPVKKEYKSRVPGTVIDRSATGNTLFIEPAACTRCYDELIGLRIEEEDEVRRILYTLTVQVDSFAEVLKQNMNTMERMDFAFSKGKLSLEYDGTEPEIIQERIISLTDARHPLLNKETCVPLQFELGGETRGIVITGPNTGGKTVAIKTVALCAMMAQCGLHVPCKNARICMFGSILCDIGDGQNLSENLSTFSAHITNVLDILKHVSCESLVIMDELGSGTDPQEGMGIAVAILEELRKSGALFLVTTHYPEVKTYAENNRGIVNARMTFDVESLAPKYQMVIGEAGQSCALLIARRLGMPSSMLQCAAEAAYGKDRLPEGLITEKDGETGQNREMIKLHTPKIIRQKEKKLRQEIPFRRGDSVRVSPDQKIGIVCQEANDKGVLRVQLPGKKIWISHKRVKLLVAADRLYPEDYDFSIIFDTVENRKLRHDMERKYVEGEIRTEELK